MKTFDGGPCPGGCGEELLPGTRYCWECKDYVDVLEAGGAQEETTPEWLQEDFEGMAGPGTAAEGDIRHGISRFLRSVGMAVYDLEQGHRPFACPACQAPIPGGSRVHEGLPDLFVTGLGTHFFVEVKSEDGARSDDQEKFVVNAKDGACPVYLWRSSAQAAAWWSHYRKERMKR